jgi:transposase
MPEKRNKYDREFREGAVRIVKETNKPIAQIALDLGVNEGTLGNWVARDREARQDTDGLSKSDIVELKRLRAEVAELRMERDVLIGHSKSGPGRSQTTSGDVLAHRGSRLRPAPRGVSGPSSMRGEPGSVVVRARPRDDVIDVLSRRALAENTDVPAGRWDR